MFDVTARACERGSPGAWRRTLAFHERPREEYIRAIGEDVGMANMHLDQPDLPALPGFKE